MVSLLPRLSIGGVLGHTLGIKTYGREEEEVELVERKVAAVVIQSREDLADPARSSEDEVGVREIHLCAAMLISH